MGEHGQADQMTAITLDRSHVASRDCWCNPYAIGMDAPLVMTSSAVVAMWHPIYEVGKPPSMLVHVEKPDNES